MVALESKSDRNPSILSIFREFKPITFCFKSNLLSIIKSEYPLLTPPEILLINASISDFE